MLEQYNFKEIDKVQIKENCELNWDIRFNSKKDFNKLSVLQKELVYIEADNYYAINVKECEK